MDDLGYDTKIGRVEIYLEDNSLRFEYNSGLTDFVTLPQDDSEIEAFIDQIEGALDGKAEEWMR